MPTRAERAAGIDHDCVGARRCLLPGRTDPEAADHDAVVKGAPVVLPPIRHVVRFDDVEPD
jgi:hypothetical protein